MKGSSQNGLSADVRDSMTLLDSTDSEVEWLNLPPIKGKKPKKRRRSKAVAQDSCCSSWAVLKGLLTVGVVGGILVLSFTSVWLTTQVNYLQEKLRTMEIRSASNGDSTQKLLIQVSSMNQTIHKQSQALQTLAKNISTINSTVQTLSGEVGLATEGLKLAPELKLLPDKLVTLSSTVAKMGSDVEGMKDKVDNFDPFMKTTNTRLGDIDTQLNTLNQSLSKSSDQPDNLISPEVANMMQDMTKQMTEMNSTLSTQVSLLMTTSTTYQEQLLEFENTTKQLALNIASVQSGSGGGHTGVPGDVDSVEFRDAVTDIVNDVLKEKGLMSNEEVHSLVDNITNILAKLQQGADTPPHPTSAPGETDGGRDVGPADHVTMAMFNTLGDGFKDKMDALNESLISLRSDVHGMSEISLKHDATLFNLSHQVQALQKYITILQHNMESTGALSTIVPTTNSPEDIEHTSDDGEELSSDAGATGAPGKPDSETAPLTENKEVSPPTAVPVKKLDISFIKSPEDFELNFSRWDMGAASGQISFDDLEGHVGTSNLPTEAEMKRLYDLDNNGLYSKDELARAFGITLSTTTSSPVPATNMTAPPR